MLASADDANDDDAAAAAAAAVIALSAEPEPRRTGERVGGLSGWRPASLAPLLLPASCRSICENGLFGLTSGLLGRLDSVLVRGAVAVSVIGDART